MIISLETNISPDREKALFNELSQIYEIKVLDVGSSPFVHPDFFKNGNMTTMFIGEMIEKFAKDTSVFEIRKLNLPKNIPIFMHRSFYSIPALIHALTQSDHLSEFSQKVLLDKWSLAKKIHQPIKPKLTIFPLKSAKTTEFHYLQMQEKTNRAYISQECITDLKRFIKAYNQTLDTEYNALHKRGQEVQYIPASTLSDTDICLNYPEGMIMKLKSTLRSQNVPLQVKLTNLKQPKGYFETD